MINEWTQNSTEINKYAKHHHSFLPLPQSPKTDDLFDWKPVLQVKLNQKPLHYVTKQQWKHCIYSIYENEEVTGEQKGLMEFLIILIIISQVSQLQ